MNDTNATCINPESGFLAVILSKSGRAIAADAAWRLLEHEPFAKEGFGTDPFSGWQHWLAARVEELASAIAFGRPEIFVDQVLWARSALGPRGIDSAHFRQGLVYLRGVLLEELPDEVRAIAAAYVDRALEAFDAPGTETSTESLGKEPFRHLVAAYLTAVLEGDGRRASQIVLSAAAQGHAVHDLYLRVIVPAQKEIGRMWVANEISIADEHLSSVTARRLMSQLVERGHARFARGKTVLVAAVAGNRHDLGTQVVADFFELDGWRTIHLGADVPADTLLDVLDSIEVDILCLSAALPVQLPVLRDTISVVRSSSRGSHIKILVGGPAFHGALDLAKQLDADAQADDARHAVLTACALMGMDA